MNAIEIKNLTKYYGKSRGVIDVNLEVKEGEISGSLDQNGAGKSTTIRTLGFSYILQKVVPAYLERIV